MSADELRKAAETLRERANAADRVTGGWFSAASLSWHEPENAGWIATMHPGVGLAMADWLDEVWGWREEGLGLMPQTNLADAWNCVERHALTVARLINGGAA